MTEKLMRYIEKQKKIENDVYDAIDEIAEELKVRVPYYPEVYWVGRTLEFGQLGMREIERDEFENVKKFRGSVYVRAPGIILINKNSLIDKSEEATHFLHLNSSKIKLSNKSKLDWIAAVIMTEMFGFFGSKLIVPDRENPCKILPNFSPIQNIEVEVYQQGYGLGERLFYSYVSGETKLEEIRKLFFDSFDRKYDASSAFLKLKQKFWS